MGENFQKSKLPTLLQFIRVRAAHQPHVKLPIQLPKVALTEISMSKMSSNARKKGGYVCKYSFVSTVNKKTVEEIFYTKYFKSRILLIRKTQNNLLDKC